MKHLLMSEGFNNKIVCENDDWCGFGSCENDCTQSCTSTGWCFLNVGH